MSTETLTTESLKEAIAASERIIFSSPHGLSGRSISSTTLSHGASLETVAELGAIWGDYTLAVGDRLIAVTWGPGNDDSGNSFTGHLETGPQKFTFNLIMPELGSHTPIQISDLREITE
jgi:hypothetical protein